jgi:hypothetical protein
MSDSQMDNVWITGDEDGVTIVIPRAAVTSR